MKIAKKLLLASLVCAPVFTTFSTQAQNSFDGAWRSLSPVSAEQARVVYYRPASLTGEKPANIYVDGEFHTSLLAGGYTVFCVAPGTHSLGSYVNDAPDYQGKRAQSWTDKLAAGKTYYIRANLDDSGRPLVVSQQQAQQELLSTKRQAHLLSRASSVQRCQEGTTEAYDKYAFSSDLLFRFGSANSNDISAQGREALSSFASMLKKENAAQRHIIVTGFTDPIGSDSSNMALGQRRAEAVKALLIAQGMNAANITAQSMGESQVDTNCSGSLQEQKACYASERRVIISVENK